MADIDFVKFRFFVTNCEIRLQFRKNGTQSQVIFELLFCWNKIFYHIENLITGSSWYSCEHMFCLQIKHKIQSYSISSLVFSFSVYTQKERNFYKRTWALTSTTATLWWSNALNIQQMAYIFCKYIKNTQKNENNADIILKFKHACSNVY